MTATAVTRPASKAALRSVDRWALVSGVTGCVANGLLLALWAVAMPGNAAYDWTGPANDVVGAVATAATVPVVLGLTRHLDGPRHLTLLAGTNVTSGAAMIVASGLLVVGLIPFTAQAAVAIPYIASLFGWLWAAGRVGRRSGRLPRRLARAAEILGMSVVCALPVAGVAVLLPQGSTLQYAVGTLALVPGVVGFLGEPAWLIAMSRRLASEG